MCGIAGILGNSAGERLVKRMLIAQEHRGPDNQGIYFSAENEIALGHNRLSILDLSSAGHQPMSCKDDRYWIVYNGEVYNYKAIRKQLLAKGYTFTSETDTEVVLYAYIEWGTHALSLLRGMFSFAIWDRCERALLLARDRFGIKPLYYSVSSERLVFSSEIKSLIATGLVSSTADVQSLYDYLSIGAIVQPRTILSEVKSLRPGHFIEFRNNEFKIKKYWDLREVTLTSRRDLRAISYPDAVAELRTKLNETAQLHMLADVPVGAFLSGGIDSTAIVGLMGQYSNMKIKTYSIGFGSDYDFLSEAKWATLAANRLGADHQNISISSQDLHNNFCEIVDSIDQPSSDGVNTFFVSQAAKSGVKVCLSGLGGDEIFGGYGHFGRILKASRLLPHGLNPRLRPFISPALSFLPGRYRLALINLFDSPLERITAIRRLYSEEKLLANFCSLAKPEELQKLEKRYSPLFDSSVDCFKNLSYIELSTYLRDTLLRDNDVMSMRASIEVRPMLLDHELAEFVYSLPTEHFFQSRKYNKPLFVDAVKDILPAEIVSRKKMGFEFPLNAWLRTSLKDIAMEQFESQPAKILLRHEFRLNCLRDLKDRESNSYLWSLFILLCYINNRGVVIPG